ncbi:MAG TPA: hypothetical protein VNN18_11660 [Candidatus Xenobia bacterium]|nr:hypothetical protein [Candidatus Xenobia bacterium]
MRRLLIALLLLGLAPAASAQQRPLTTEEVETTRSGDAYLQFGFDFLQDVRFPLSGLRGDLTRVGVSDLRIGVGRAAEVQIQWTIHQFLSVSEQTPAVIVPKLKDGGMSASDVGDVTVAAKFRFLEETDRRPAIGIRFGFETPTTNEVRGIGLNTTNIFFTVLAQKHFGTLNVWGHLGVGILQAPGTTFTQNDVVLYGLAALYPVHPRLNLVGEVAGRWSPREITPSLIGTESRSQARAGIQLFAGGLRWDAAAIFGLTKHDADTGFTLGVSRPLTLWHDYDKPR